MEVGVGFNAAEGKGNRDGGVMSRENGNGGWGGVDLFIICGSELVLSLYVCESTLGSALGWRGERGFSFFFH